MTESAPAARLLDVSRLVSRAGRTLTGIDRVEAAYLRELIADDTPIYGLCRTSVGYILTDRDGLRAFADLLRTGDWPPLGWFARFVTRGRTEVRQAQDVLRRHAIGRCRPVGLSALLAPRLPKGSVYLNVGHSNLTAATLSAIRAAGLGITVMVHDVIPLMLPQMQRRGSVEVFRGKMQAVVRFADQVICISQAACDDVVEALGRLGRVPSVTVAPLGVDLAIPEAVPAGVQPQRPYFMTVGTIEPRKNHALLLDVWETHVPDADLLICGARGWRNELTFGRLNRGIAGVSEHSNLSDGAIATLLQGARGMLFPSLAEGFGLPMAEAAALGCPVICGDLAICREVLGDAGVYLDPTDAYLWGKTIKDLLARDAPTDPPVFVPTTWADHFKIVLNLT